MKKLWALGFVALGLTACLYTSAVRLGIVQDRPTVRWYDVAVYRTAEQVPGKYEEVALLVSTGNARWTSEGDMWRQMQKEAGWLGANAIILGARSEPMGYLGKRIKRKGEAIAIYVFPEEKKNK